VVYEPLGSKRGGSTFSGYEVVVECGRVECGRVELRRLS